MRSNIPQGLNVRGTSQNQQDDEDSEYDDRQNQNNNSLSLEQQNKSFYDDLKKANQMGNSNIRGGEQFIKDQKRVPDNFPVYKEGVRTPKGFEGEAQKYDLHNKQEITNDINSAARKIGSVNPFGGENRLSNYNFNGALRGSYVNNQKINEQDISTDQADFHTKNNSGNVSTNSRGKLDQFSLQSKNQKGIFQQQLPQTAQKGQASKVHNFSSKMKSNVPWILLGIIGMWVFIFMISQLSDFSGVSIIVENKYSDMVLWYSKDLKMGEAAASYYLGMGKNYISLLDFIVFFFVTKCVYNYWLTEDYFLKSPIKDNLSALFLIKDVIIIILSLASGNYSMNGGWSQFGFFWLSTFGKLSIILSLQKIIFFRLNYFRIFGVDKTGCKSVLKSYGTSIYQWASKSQTRRAEPILMIIIFSLYLPLILHVLVGVLEATYIVIIWVAILFFLQQAMVFIFELFQRRIEDKTLMQRLVERQSFGVVIYIDKFWVFLVFLFVIIPGVASCSFAASFEKSIRFHFVGQQLALNFFAIPLSTSSASNKLTFICNILSLF